MSLPLSATGKVKNFAALRTSGDGPAPHEDLTIAEQLETMHVVAEHRPDEVCFIDTKGENHWLAESDLKRFITEHGAEHSSTFVSVHGTDWQNQLFDNH